MKLTVKVHYAFLHTLVGTSLGSGTNLSSKTPRRYLEEDEFENDDFSLPDIDQMIFDEDFVG